MGEDEKTLDEKMDYIRVQIKEIAGYVQDVKNNLVNPPVGSTRESFGEVMANLTLSYRHLEDASMRIGKVKQALNDGISVYDKNVVGSPE